MFVLLNESPVPFLKGTFRLVFNTIHFFRAAGSKTNAGFRCFRVLGGVSSTRNSSSVFWVSDWRVSDVAWRSSSSMLFAI